MLTEEEFAKFETGLEYSADRRSDRVHIGLVQLSTDHCLETDWAKIAGNQAAIFSNRVYYSSVMNKETLAGVAREISQAAKLIATGLPMDVMAFGCTSASMIIGSDKVKELLTVHCPGVPATNPWIASKAAFRRLNAQKIAIFSPYPTGVNFPLYRELAALGFDVPVVGALGIEKDTQIAKVSFASMVKGIERMLEKNIPDLIFMSCTNLRILDHIQELEAMFNIPVVSSNQAMFWHAMILAGKKARCSGFGRLLDLEK